MKQKQVKIGQIVRPFKVLGELKVKCYTDIPQERFKVGNTVILKTKDRDIETKILSFRMHQDHALITCDAVPDRNEAEKYRFVIIEQVVKVDPSRITLSDLEGCQVFNFNESIGVVSEALSYPASTILKVKLNQGNEIMIPYVDRFVKKVDLETMSIYCELIEGFL
jgi:16S rRNA processing protein RimM